MNGYSTVDQHDGAMQKQHQEMMDSRNHSAVLTDDLGVDEPQNWPLVKKVGVTLASSGYTFALLYGASSYTTGIQGVMSEFNVSMTRAIVPFSLYIWGIMFAPLYSPHVSERIGRNRFYQAANLGLGVFTLGAAFSRTYTQLAVCRFFAGLLGGSSAVQIEGTFADVWPALYANSYYIGIAGAQYFGAATGAVVGHYVVPFENWRWGQYTTLMFVLAALLLGLNAPETYRRELVRQRARLLNVPSPLGPALSGVTFKEMAQLTLINPLIIFAAQPLVTMITLYLALNFGVLFAFFILVPVVLEGVAKFTQQHVGTAFIGAIAGTAVAMIIALAIDQLVIRAKKRKSNGMMDIEFRLYPAMFGAILITTSLFWIGFTATPAFRPVIPIVGTAVYVTGSALTLISFVSYLFDAYGPPGTLSALTVAAVTRIALAGTIPLLIIPAVTNITGKWALGVFGFISIAFLPFPFIIFFFGKRSRTSSRFFDQSHPSPMYMDMQGRNPSQGQSGHESSYMKGERSDSEAQRDGVNMSA